MKKTTKQIALPASATTPTPHRFVSDKFRVVSRAVITVKEMEHILADFNQYNRPRTAPWQEYCRDIEAGEFRYDVGHCIKFTAKGYVVDGGHRLFAHWAAKKPLQTIVIMGLPEDSILFQDNHAPRKSFVNPVLYRAICRGVPATPEENKVQKWSMSLARLMIIQESNWKDSPGGNRQNRYLNDNNNLAAVVCGMKGVHFGRLSRSECWTRRPGARAAIALYAKQFPEAASAFRDEVYGNGDNVLSGSPVDLLRKILMAPAKGGDSMYDETKYAMDAIQHFHARTRHVEKLILRTRFDF